MATYRNANLDVEVSGSIGPITFRPSGTVGTISNRRSVGSGNDRLVRFQLEANKAASRAWSELSDEDREEWQAWPDQYQAGFGFTQVVPTTGHALYLQTAIALYRIRGSIPRILPALQIQGRKQTLPKVFPDPASGRLLIDQLGPSTLWLPDDFSWMRLRLSRMTRPSVKRPPRTWSETHYITAGELPLFPDDPPFELETGILTLNQGWFRIEYSAGDEFGWWSIPREQIIAVEPSSRTWYLAYGPELGTEPAVTITYDGKTLSASTVFNSFPVTFSDTVGPGGLETVGDVALFLDNNVGMRPWPESVRDSEEPADTLQIIPGARTDRRGSPIPLRF